MWCQISKKTTFCKSNKGKKTSKSVTTQLAETHPEDTGARPQRDPCSHLPLRDRTSVGRASRNDLRRHTKTSPKVTCAELVHRSTEHHFRPGLPTPVRIQPKLPTPSGPSSPPHLGPARPLLRVSTLSIAKDDLSSVPDRT